MGHHSDVCKLCANLGAMLHGDHADQPESTAPQVFILQAGRVNGMLSDTSIRRDKNYSLPRRALLKLRAKCAAKGRAQLDAVMRDKLKDVEFTILSNNCLGG